MPIEPRAQLDAIVLTGGATTGQARDLPVPGRELKGIHFAMLPTQQNRRNEGDHIPEAGRHHPAAGVNVVIIGGGDTGADCPAPHI